MRQILVVDDNALMRETLVRLLGPAGQVMAVGSGAAALAACAQAGFDLVLMDIRMPDMDGIMACRALRESGMGAPILAITADAGVQADAGYASAGFTGLIEKPFEARELLQCVADCLDSRSEMRSDMERVKGIEPSS